MKSFNDLLSSPQIRAIIRKTAELTELSKLLHAALPPELQGRYRVQNFNQGYLRLETDSAVWLTRLRYLTPILIKQLALKLPGLINIQCSVKPPISNPAKTAKTINPLSNSTQTLLKSTANTISNPRLQAALKKLAEAD